jgi:hypothetical protein
VLVLCLKLGRTSAPIAEERASGSKSVAQTRVKWRLNSVEPKTSRRCYVSIRLIYECDSSLNVNGVCLSFCQSFLVVVLMVESKVSRTGTSDIDSAVDSQFDVRSHYVSQAPSAMPRAIFTERFWSPALTSPVGSLRRFASPS